MFFKTFIENPMMMTLLINIFIFLVHKSDAEPALEGEFPYQVSLRDGSTGKHFCSGVILNNRFILTTAHCSIHHQPNLMTAVSESNYNNIFVDQHIAIEEIIIHESFNSETKHSDIALLKTVGEIPFNTNVQKISIADPIKPDYFRGLIVSGRDTNKVSLNCFV